MTTTRNSWGQTGAGAVDGRGEPGPGGAGAGGVAPAGAVDLAADAAALEEIVSRLTSCDAAVEPVAHSGIWLGESAVRVHRVVQRLTGVRLQWLLAEDADGRWALGGARTLAQHVAHAHRVSQSRSRSEVRLARQLRDEAGLFGQAVRRGDLGMEQAEVLTRGVLTSAEWIAGLQVPMRADGGVGVPGAAEGPGGAAGNNDGADADADAGPVPVQVLRRMARCPGSGLHLSRMCRPAGVV